MPTGPIVADNYIDDPNRTTEEVQDALNQNFDYLRSMQSELGALSSTVLREASVRSVGNSAGNVPDKAVLDSRLGTTGNLGGSATTPLSELFSKSGITSPQVIFSGSATSVAAPSAGVYLVYIDTSLAGFTNCFAVVVRDLTESITFGTISAGKNGSNLVLKAASCINGSFNVTRWTQGDFGNTTLNITRVEKIL